jgi:hypothetical protein
MLLFDSIIIGKLLNQCGVGVDNFNGNYDDTKEGYWLGLSLETLWDSRIAKKISKITFTNIIIIQLNRRKCILKVFKIIYNCLPFHL